ncbi:putative methylated-DNA--protein-cysteine methyltransferase [Magnetofaba australis IT-1]|uniref:methylated-DNA--[protein]-cysteine S-methyltransferase n=1 Tax=Magnetofaba australis IT-1 TaxID=1434232 RepID=A0A1Y2JZS9_9PROT|nr:putative methylated-DNA--protein-cysteine methyltransferase [Magnetofaba australis IT-1]
MDAYFGGRFEPFPILLQPAGGAFYQRVWQALLAIEPGQTRTYGEVAQALGSGARAVGNAVAANPIPVIIPCHRVVGKSGLGGYSGDGGLTTKTQLLRLEGALPGEA